MDQQPDQSEELVDEAIESEPADGEETEYPKVEGAGVRWIKEKIEETSLRWVLGEGLGFLGGAALVATSFLVISETSTSQSGRVVNEYTFHPGILVVGVALIVGCLLAWFWKDSYAGSILVLAAGGIFIYAFTFYLRVSDVYLGAWLSFVGGWLGLAGGLVMLAERKNITIQRESDEEIADLREVLAAMLVVWDEADLIVETLRQQEEPDFTGYRAATDEAQDKLDAFTETWGA